MWAHVAAGVITAWGDLPSLWWDGARQWDLRDPANIAPAGWVEVIETTRPDDTATTTTEETVQLVAGVPTRVWTARAKTQAEIDGATIANNESDLVAKAKSALATNAAFLALSAPTNAQTLAQVKALTREVSALIRLGTRELLSTGGT